MRPTLHPTKKLSPYNFYMWDLNKYIYKQPAPNYGMMLAQIQCHFCLTSTPHSPRTAPIVTQIHISLLCIGDI